MEKKKQKGPVSVTKEKPIIKPAKKAPGNKQNLSRGVRIKKLPNGCTEREDKFVQAYLATWCVSDAVRMAGFECKNAASYGNEIMKKPHIAKLIEEGRKEYANSIVDLRNRLVNAYVDIAFSDITEFVDLVKVKNAKGVETVVPQFKTTEAFAQGRGKIIKKMEIGRNMSVKIELESKSDAMLQLAKYTGEFFAKDNEQQNQVQAVEIYIPDNGRNDTYKPEEKP